MSAVRTKPLHGLSFDVPERLPKQVDSVLTASHQPDGPRRG